jgi:hypothetical protein
LISSPPRHGERSGEAVLIDFRQSRHADLAERLAQEVLGQEVHVPIGTGATISPNLTAVIRERIRSRSCGMSSRAHSLCAHQASISQPEPKEHDQPYQKE